MFVLPDFAIDTLLEYKQLSRVQQLASKQSSGVEIPNLLKDETWETWETTLTNFFMSCRGVSNIPLAYVILQIPRDNTIVSNRDTEILYGAPLSGAAFDSERCSLWYHSSIDI